MSFNMCFNIRRKCVLLRRQWKISSVRMEISRIQHRYRTLFALRILLRLGSRGSRIQRTDLAAVCL